METQVFPPNEPFSADSIGTFGPESHGDTIDMVTVTPKPSQKRQHEEDLVDNGLDCECGVSVRYTKSYSMISLFKSHR